MKVSVLAFDLSDNSTGRADLLARLLAPRYTVEVVGPRFDAEVWRPARDGAIAYRTRAGARYPAFAALAAELARLADGDVLLASKPRPTSFGVALLARRQRPRPLILDVDDWELGFFYRSGIWGRLGRALNLANPNGLPWTWLTERLIGRADALIVASRFLERRFGGTLIPHVRDTDAWDPARRPAPRRLAARLGADDDEPRSLQTVHRRHEILDALVAVPQRATSDTVGQVPAKLFDAMAMARPIVSTSVSMIPEILEGCGLLVPPGEPRALRAMLETLLSSAERAQELGRRARARCIERYSFTAARAVLFPLVDGLVAR